MSVKLLSAVSAIALFAAIAAPLPAFAADDAIIEKLSKMIEAQQKVLEAQSKELNTMRQELKSLNTKQEATTAALTKPATPVVSPINDPIPKKATAGIQPTAPSSGVKTADAHLPAERKYVEEGSFPGSIRIPGTGASFKIGGQVKMDGIYTPNNTPALAEDVFFTRTIQTNAASKTGRTRMLARDTRLNFDLRAPTEYGDLKVFSDFDLYGNAQANAQNQLGGYDIRLRHAYVQIGQFLAGQSWSNFNDPASFAETLDFAQVNGESFIRQPQFRWTSLKHDDFTFAASAENPEGDISDNTAPGTGRRTNADNLPDMVASLSLDKSWGHLQTAALYRRIKVEGDTIAPVFSDSANGYGVNIGGRINTPLINEKDTVRFQANYGDGIGRYINDLQNVGTESFDATVNASNTQIDTLKAFGGYTSYQALFNPKWRSNLTGGYVTVSQPGYQPGTVLSSTAYAAANVIWSPVPKLDVGFETLWGYRENKNDQSGNATRFITSVKYIF